MQPSKYDLLANSNAEAGLDSLGQHGRGALHPVAEKLLPLSLACRFVCIASALYFVILGLCFAHSQTFAEWVLGPSTIMAIPLIRYICFGGMFCFALLSVSAWHARNLLQSNIFSQMMHNVSTTDIPECNRFITLSGWKRAYISLMWRTALITICACFFPPHHKMQFAFLGATGSLLLSGHDFAWNLLWFCIKLCRWDIRIVLSMMSCPSTEIDWRAVSRAHLNMDSNFERLWKQASFILLPCFAGTFGMVMSMMVFAIVVPELGFKFIFLVSGLNILFGTVYNMLWKLAGITDMCMNNMSTSGSIVANTIRFVGDLHMSQSSRADYLEYMQFQAMTKTGVELCGILITKSVILSCGLKALAYVPAIVGIASALIPNNNGNLKCIFFR